MTWYGMTELPVTSFKQMFAVTLGKMLQTEPTSPSDSMTPYLNSAAVQDGYVEDSKLKSMWASDTDRRNLSIRADDLVVCEGGDVGRSALVKADSPAIFQNSVHRVRPRQGNDIRFAKYTLDALRASSYLDVLCNKATIRHFTADKLANLEVPHASASYQSAACDFLDRETAQIDELICKQERLIGLLAEKRQAIITHAVTKGLDPDAPTKPSGIPWLGDIPTHWTQKPMCHFMAGRVDYRGATPKKTDDGVFLVTAKNVRKGFIDYSASAEYIAAEDYDSVMSRGIPAIGDILMTMEAPLGNFALIDDPKVALAQRVVKFRPKAELLSAFAIYAANSPYFQAQLEERATGSTALGIKASKLIELRLTAPSREEQRSIVDFLDAAIGRIDGLTQRAKAAISLLRERRSALISAAVSGKIDVREGTA